MTAHTGACLMCASTEHEILTCKRATAPYFASPAILRFRRDAGDRETHVPQVQRCTKLGDHCVYFVPWLLARAIRIGRFGSLLHTYAGPLHFWSTLAGSGEGDAVVWSPNFTDSNVTHAVLLQPLTSWIETMAFLFAISW